MVGKFLNKHLVVLWLVFGSILCNDEDDGKITFNGPISRSATPRMSLEMEIQLAQEYNQIENIQDIIDRIDGIPPGVDLTGTDAIANRFGGEERSNAEIPKAATCAPELQPVSLKNSSVPSSAIYIPNCTRVPRCGGCCGHSSLSCEPTAFVVRNFQVIITEFDVNTRLTYKKKEIVPIEEHTKCACGCKTKAHHCNEKQIYLPKECRCACTNVDEESKCSRNNDTKRWDENLCVCQCRGSTECTTGSYYDHSTCSCKKVGIGGRIGYDGQAALRQRSHDIGSRISASGHIPPVFSAVSADDPRRRHREDPEE